MKTTHEEADNIIVQQMVAAANESQKGISVLSDDTDVFVLLLYHYLEQNLKLPVIMESPIKDRKTVDIRETVRKNRDIIPDLISAHAISGCDTVACCYGIGKGKVLKTLRSGQTLGKLGDPDEDLSDIIPEATAFMSACYGHPQSGSMSITRQKMWTSKVGKSAKAVPKFASLSPTTEAFTENVKRAHHQACVWKHALDSDPPDMAPTNFGWIREEATRSLSPVTVPRGISLAPEEILQLIKCQCDSEEPC